MARAGRAKPQTGKPKSPAFEIRVHATPVSSQTHRRSRLNGWKSLISANARENWTRRPLEGPVRMRVTHYDEMVRIDRDNLIKPIQDALQGVVFLNDKQVMDTEGRFRNINEPVRIRFISPVLAMAFSDGRPSVHIELWDDPDLEGIV